MNKIRRIMEFLENNKSTLDAIRQDTFTDSTGKVQYKAYSKREEDKALQLAIKKPTRENIINAMQISGMREDKAGRQYEASYILDSIWNIIEEL